MLSLLFSFSSATLSPRFLCRWTSFGGVEKHFRVAVAYDPGDGFPTDGTAYRLCIGCILFQYPETTDTHCAVATRHKSNARGVLEAYRTLVGGIVVEMM